MKIKLTIYLKTGEELVSFLCDEVAKDMKERYSSMFLFDKKVLNVDDGRVIQIVPFDNISFIEIKEVAE